MDVSGSASTNYADFWQKDVTKEAKDDTRKPRFTSIQMSSMVRQFNLVFY